ncbi:hypothetical protein BaRGS_00008720, partial [Batillaria attramentaria]
VTGEKNTQITKASSACYSTGDCGFHFLSCDPGLIIALRTTYYGFKSPQAYVNRACKTVLTNCADYVNKSSCCVYDVTSDCLKAYSSEHQAEVREVCDGKRKCTFHAPYMSGSCDKPGASYDDLSSFSVIHYVCENDTARQETNTTLCDECTTESRTRQHEEDIKQLIVGVSVGVGVGLVALIVIAVVCWVRIRRKPLPMASTAVGATGHPHDVFRRPSTTHTHTSSLPASLISSFYTAYSTDTLPSSRQPSLYSVPADVISTTSSLDRDTFLRHYGYDDVDFRSGDYLGRSASGSRQDRSYANGVMSSTPQGNGKKGPALPESMSPVASREDRHSVTFQPAQPMRNGLPGSHQHQPIAAANRKSPRSGQPILSLLTASEVHLNDSSRVASGPSPDGNSYLPEDSAAYPESGENYVNREGVYSVPDKSRKPGKRDEHHAIREASSQHQGQGRFHEDDKLGLGEEGDQHVEDHQHANYLQAVSDSERSALNGAERSNSDYEEIRL